MAGHALRAMGYEDFVILERQERAGGTWARNRYPGLACDIPSHLYSFSFAPKADWSRTYAPQGEILDYMEECVDSLGLRHHLRLGHGVRSARWDDARATWTVTTEAGEEIVADVVITSTGMFGSLVWPDIVGRDTFAGISVHTAEWPAELDLAGRRVAVVGTRPGGPAGAGGRRGWPRCSTCSSARPTGCSRRPTRPTPPSSWRSSPPIPRPSPTFGRRSS